MKSHTLDYIALTLAALLWFAFLLSGTPYAPPAVPKLPQPDSRPDQCEHQRSLTAVSTR